MTRLQRWLSATDVNAQGNARSHILPMYSSADMVHWAYAGDAQTTTPSWVGSGDLWAPDVVYNNEKYLLYYTASDTAGSDGANSGGGAAIGVLQSSSPLGPWTDSGGPVIAPEPNPYSPSQSPAVYDPEVITAGGTSYIYYGCYAGGISARQLSSNGLSSKASSEKQIAIDNRYEGTFIVRHNGWYYFMGTSTNCRAGPLTGYAVFAGRSRSPLGPFLDKDGVSLLDTRVGGTPVLSQNGNQWIGGGGSTVVADFSGQEWIYYHAVDQNNPLTFRGKSDILSARCCLIH